MTHHKTNNKKNKVAGIIDLPDESQRLLEQEIKGEEEYNAELRRKKADIDDSPFDQLDQLDFGSKFSAKKSIDERSQTEEFEDMRQSVLVGFRKNSDVKYEDFKIKMLLGRGTFGKVFLAELVKK
jgi:hypothetical protein